MYSLKGVPDVRLVMLIHACPHTQQVFVILAFSEHHLEWAVDLIG